MTRPSSGTTVAVVTPLLNANAGCDWNLVAAITAGHPVMGSHLGETMDAAETAFPQYNPRNIAQNKNL